MHYVRIESEGALIERLSEGGAAIIAGGTDLLVKMRAGRVSPRLILDVSEVPTLRGVSLEGGYISIGAATTHADLSASPVIRERLPLLVRVLESIGSPQIRNRGTIGGNLANASPAADSAVPLLLYDASLIVAGRDGERAVPLERFFRGPGETALSRGEFIRRIRIPLPEERFSAFFHKVGKRKALTIAIASLGSLIRIEAGLLAEARFAAGSVAPTPIRFRRLEQRLIGREMTDALIAEGREIAMESVSPIDDIRASAGYRREVIGDLVVRALATARRGS